MLTLHSKPSQLLRNHKNKPLNILVCFSPEFGNFCASPGFHATDVTGCCGISCIFMILLSVITIRKPYFIPQPRHSSCRKRVCGNVCFLHGWLDVFTHLHHRLWDESKNPLGASSAPRMHSACGLVLSRLWWPTSLGNVWFPHRYQFLIYCW